MARMKRRLQHLVERVGDRRGGVAVMVAIVVVALIGMVALAVDVSAAVSARTRLQEAADVAALTAVRQAAVMTRANNSADLTAAQNAGLQRFNAQASSTPRVKVNGVTVDVTRSGLTITSTVRFNATYATQVAGALGAFSPGMSSLASLPLGGQVGARQDVGAYINIQVLMDTSNSMAIALADTTTPQGTPATQDTTNLKALTSQWPWYNWPSPGLPRVMLTNCQFACHATLSQVNETGAMFWRRPGTPLYRPAYANYTAITTKWWMASSGSATTFPDAGIYPAGRFTDFYTLAKKNGIQLRIDVLKQAVGNIVAAISNNDKFRFGFYTFDADPNADPNAGSQAATYPVEAYPLGPAAGAATVVSGTEVTPYPWGGPGFAGNASQTTVAASIRDFDLNYAVQAGDGSSAQQPKRYAVIITDGIEDYPGNTADPTSGSFPRDYAAFDSTACDGLKAKGYTVIVLQAASLDNFITGGAGDAAGDSGVDPATLFNSSVAAMQRCASGSGYYFLASDPVDIQKATQAIINLTLTQVTVMTQGNTSTVKQ